MPKAAETFIEENEFTQIEILLGCLLKEADEREKALILQIHQRLSHLRDNQSHQQQTLEYLTCLAS